MIVSGHPLEDMHCTTCCRGFLIPCSQQAFLRKSGKAEGNNLELVINKLSVCYEIVELQVSDMEMPIQRPGVKKSRYQDVIFGCRELKI